MKFPLPFRFKTDFFTVVIDSLDTKCLVTGRINQKFKLSIEDIKYVRGKGDIITWIGSLGCKSCSYLQFSPLENTLYLPGSGSDDLHPFATISESDADWFINNRTGLPPVKGKVGDGLYKIGISDRTQRCKEFATRDIVNTQVSNFHLDVTLNEEESKTLESWCNHHPICVKGSEVTLKYTWWFNYERIGWLLLAARVVCNKYAISNKRFADNFNHFIENGEVKDEISPMTYTSNWIATFA